MSRIQALDEITARLGAPALLRWQKWIERAIELLLNRRKTVVEVAILLGFSSPSHFVSTFRRLVRVTPASLRRAARC